VHADLNTVLVDLDPQMNATTTVEIDETGPSVADVLNNPRRSIVNDALRKSPWSDLLRVLPGSEDTEAHNNPDPTAKQLARLTTAIAKVDPAPDLVLIDCPPSLGQLTRSALVASDRAVLVTEPSLYAVTGVQRALEAVQKERLTHRHLQPLGVVVNRVRPRITEHDYRLAELRDLFGPLVLNPPLPDRAAIQQAQGAAVPIHSWPTAGAREIASMFDALLERLMRSAKQKSRI
jgi:chromosome partitioning protein